MADRLSRARKFSLSWSAAELSGQHGFQHKAVSEIEDLRAEQFDWLSRQPDGSFLVSAPCLKSKETQEAFPMEKMIGYCGYNCHLCAARSDDPALRQSMVDGWRKFFGHQNYTVENVKCDGCLSDGQVADKICQARPCAREKGVENCVYCDEFPCDKMKHLMTSREGMLIRGYPGTCSVTEEEYNLCMRQFESMPNLLGMLVSSGKISSWVADRPEASRGTGKK